MSRIVTKTAHGPKEIKPQDTSVWICMCGLSKNQPFCDSSHKKTLQEDDTKTYCYNEDGSSTVCEEACCESCACCENNKK